MLSKLFSGGAADLVKGVGGVIDNLHTSAEEKLEAERKIKELVANYQIEMEKNITSRWEADLKSDSWLSKNTRPMALIFLSFMAIAFIWVDSHHEISFTVEQEWIELLKQLLTTVYVAYFGSRGFEKYKSISNK